MVMFEDTRNRPVETGLFWLSSRYYSTELCRFISPDSIEYLDPSSINGLNLCAYCGNDPVNRFDPTGHFAISSFLKNIIAGEKPKSSTVLIREIVSNSMINDPGLSNFFGNITYTASKQCNEGKRNYAFLYVCEDGYSVGTGRSYGDWFGTSMYLTSDLGFGASVQVTPWLTGGLGWSLKDGLSITGGVIVGDITHKVTVSVGNGALLGYAVCLALVATPIPGVGAIAAATAGVIFVIGLFK